MKYLVEFRTSVEVEADDSDAAIEAAYKTLVDKNDKADISYFEAEAEEI